MGVKEDLQRVRVWKRTLLASLLLVIGKKIKKWKKYIFPSEFDPDYDTNGLSNVTERIGIYRQVTD